MQLIWKQKSAFLKFQKKELRPSKRRKGKTGTIITDEWQSQHLKHCPKSLIFVVIKGRL